jgi:Cytochrome c554 and c-prime
MPADCGQCHIDQFQQWRDSRHAHAFSPGLVGQLLTFDAVSTVQCLQCHAPLAERLTDFETKRAQGMAHISEGLAAAGNACGGCHLRRYQHFGPPQRGTGATGASQTTAPHGGVFRTAIFESSEFCSACHQFPADLAVNGKPLENTYAEWKVSPQAAQGMTCQSCHMPDRQHLWRGIHDPAMVTAGLTARTSVDDLGAHFEIANTGTGQAFPTYAVPRIVMHAVALDNEGQPKQETERSHVIMRIVQYQAGRWIEISDTRLMPTQTASLAIAWNGSDRVRVWLDIIPDYSYEADVFPILQKALPAGSAAAQLIAEAGRKAVTSSFRLFETELSRP